MPSIRKLESVWPSYGLCKITKFFMKCVSCTKFYTEYFTMRHYAGFLQIGSQIAKLWSKLVGDEQNIEHNSMGKKNCWKENKSKID